MVLLGNYARIKPFLRAIRSYIGQTRKTDYSQKQAVPRRNDLFGAKLLRYQAQLGQRIDRQQFAAAVLVDQLVQFLAFHMGILRQPVELAVGEHVRVLEVLEAAVGGLQIALDAFNRAG